MAYRGKHLPQKKKKVKDDKKKPSKAFVIIIIVLLALVVLFCAALLFVNSYLNKIDRVDENIEVVAPENQDFETEIDPESVDPNITVTKPEDVEWVETEKLQDDDLINIMLVGQDSRGNTRERSDTMILCSINPRTGEVSIVSFLRDMYVQMPDGYMDNRMNAAYAFGGFPFLYEVMEKNFGITCDGGLEVNFNGFKEIVDVIGGVDIVLTSGEAAIVGTYMEGVNHLNGEQALTYARIRKLDNDFGRTNRQRNVINAILNKVRNLSVTELFSLVNTCLEFVTTDMTNAEILDIATVALPLVANLQLESYRIPTDDAYYMTMIRDMSVLVPNLELCQQYLKEDFLPFD